MCVKSHFCRIYASIGIILVLSMSILICVLRSPTGGDNPRYFAVSITLMLAVDVLLLISLFIPYPPEGKEEEWKKVFVEEVKQRRRRWLGHVLRMNKNRYPHAARRLVPPGKRKRGRSLDPWTRTVEAGIKSPVKIWNEISRLVRNGLRIFVDVFCSEILTKSEKIRVLRSSPEEVIIQV